MTYGSETWLLTMGLLGRLRVAQRAMEIRNEEIRGRTGVTNTALRVARLKWKWTKNRWTLGFLGAGMATPQVNEALSAQRGGQTESNDSQGVAGNKRPRTVEFLTPYKRPMSSSGRQSV
ncbi:jg17525 [Pararge aegeria aegeria]|uniref:Jg17525 protein n=1 Tax=Pararge aegeria aegeria TaxID=348720 RepID=A0A8S4S7R7_9NEOP|nr:jg17525 [Pararge aegeria aegeria]